MTLKRTHLLLEPEQQQSLYEIALREGKSVSEIAREMIRYGIEQKDQEYRLRRDRRLAALEKAARLRTALRDAEDVSLLDNDLVELIDKMREDRDGELLDSGG